MADDLVLDALKAAIRQDGDILLVKASKQAGLFKSRTGRANQEAMAARLKSDPPLLEVTREEKGSGQVSEPNAPQDPRGKVKATLLHVQS